MKEPPGLEAKGLSKGPSPAPFEGVALGDGMACAHWCRLDGVEEGEGVRKNYFTVALISNLSSEGLALLWCPHASMIDVTNSLSGGN